MLGLFGGHHGQGSHFKTGVREPSVTEIIPSPVAEAHNPHDSRPKEPSSPSALLSPTLSAANTLQVSKRQSSYNRTASSVRASFGRFTNAFVREQHSIVRRRAEYELGEGMHEHIYNTSYEGLLQWIKSERLMRLPHKGGSWDRVLIAAQYFAEQVHHFHHHIETFTEESGSATNFVFGQCLLLLNLGHENAAALEKAFNLFYQFGLDLSPLLQRADLFNESRAIMEDLGRAFADLLQIVTGISITFYQAVHSGKPSTKIDIFSSFSSIIETFRLRVHRCSREMWDAALMDHASDGRQVEVLQRWLAPTDSVLAFLSSNHVSIACRPEQFTCIWFQSHLSAFLKSRENILLIEGKVGSGKTTLANWIIDRLQRPISRRHVSTISFFYDYSVAAQSTPLAMLRTMFNQLLAARIGNIQLFNAANQAYLESKEQNLAEQETAMWRAFSKALEAVSREEEDTLVMVVDGVSESDTVAQQSCKKLHELALKYTRVRMIQSSQPISHKPQSSIRVELSTENMIDDIRILIRRKLHAHQHFADRDIGDQEDLIERIASGARGSMLWSYLVCKLLQRQHSCKDFDDTLNTLLTGPVATADVAHKLFTSLALESECKDLLSVLIAAERPLHLSEIEALFSVKPEQLTLTSQPVDIHSSLRHISPLVLLSEGLVAIRHDAIRQALLDVKSDAKFVEKLKYRHQDILIRLFVATKISLRSEHEPTFNRLDILQTENKLRGHPLMEYTVRYWTLHMKKTLFFKPTGALQLPKEFKTIFSDSVNFCLLEQACWGAQFFIHEALEMHNIAFRVRKGLFQQNHPCVLQSAIFYASLCESVVSRHEEAIEWYALAARISAAISVQSEITITCCNALLRISQASITKKRTTIMGYREEVLLIMVSSYKVRYGSASKELLEIYKRLHEFYLLLEEETKITEIVAIIQQLTVVIYGSQSDEAQTISRHAQVLLKHREHAEEIETFDGFIFRGYTEEVEESLTIVRIEEIIREAVTLITRGELERAEELYIELWLKLGKHCQLVHSCEWHEIKIRVMVIYAEFLITRKRITEASAILVAIWTEYESHEFSMIESIMLLFKRVALCLKEVKLLALALLVFQRCYIFFKHEHKEHSIIFKEVETQISIISTEITKTESKTIETSSETVIRSVFETSMSSATISTTSFELCESLVSIYQRQSQWSEAITCMTRVIVKAWSSFFSESIETITMIEKFRSETIKLIITLAKIYIEMRKLERAEDIYIRLYWAHRSYSKIDSSIVIEYRDELLQFYQLHEMFTRTICFYQELLVDYRRHCGATHALTIDVLYMLGHLCRRYQANYGYWLEYYLEIVSSLNKEAHVCHKEAFKALVIIAEHYYETLRHSESLVYFRLIFATFYKHGLEYKYFESVTEVKFLIKHYFHSIEESKVEIHEHIRILKELREACFKHYGTSHEITLNVTVTLAETCCTSEHFQFEAISFYELIIKHSSSFSQEIIKRTETSLKTLYVKQVTTKSTTITKETLERATTIVYKRYIEIRKDYPCSHEITLTHLKELIMMYHKQVELKIDIKAMELAIKELKTVIIDCITKITSAKELIEAATTLSWIYLTYGLVSRGFDLVKELKLQVIYKWTENCSHWGFKIISVGRESFAFIAAFEYYLYVERRVSLSVFMSDLVAEHLFYGRLMHYIKTQKQTEMVFMCAARLCQILIRNKRVTMFTIIEQKVVHYFIDVEKTVMKTSSKETVQVLISVILKYFSEHSMWKSWTAAVGYATICHLKILLKEQKHKQALELTRCTFRFLMEHEGLDDPTEITLGFQLCLMMAGRTDDQALNQKSADGTINKAMIDLSRQIIAEVFDICKNFKFNLAQCKLEDLNSLTILIGEQKDYDRLQWLLELLWSSREGQSSWSSEVVLALGKRLVQAQFASGDKSKAIRLCENIVYNVRRVHGVRHYRAISFNALLASMYTSLALKYSEEAIHENNKNKSHARDMARVYFKKAIQVHEEVLKQIVNTDDADDSDCDDDESDYTDVMSAHRGLAGTRNGNAPVGCGLVWPSREQELHSIKLHIRRLQLALQRYGGFVKPSSTYEKLTGRVWETYHKDPSFNMGKDQVLANTWKIEGYGSGRAEGDVSEDEFRVPKVWWIIEP